MICLNPECGRDFFHRNAAAKFCSDECKNRYGSLKRYGHIERPPPRNFREAFIAGHLESDRRYRARTPGYGTK